MRDWKFMLLTFVMLAAAGRPAAAPVPFESGERIVFSIKKLMIKAGEGSLVFHGLTPYKGRRLLHISFKATALNFLDMEEIYCDPDTYHPVFVERNLNIWGKRETIVEDYTSEPGKVIITKTAKGKVTTTVLGKSGRMDNIYCFLYRYRCQRQFANPGALRLNLPTADVFLDVTGKKKISAGGRVFEADYLESQSGEYRLWFGPAPEFIPLRIDGAIGLGSASLIMTDYQP